jgi:hypothetical protein
VKLWGGLAGAGEGGGWTRFGEPAWRVRRAAGAGAAALAGVRRGAAVFEAAPFPVAILAAAVFPVALFAAPVFLAEPDFAGAAFKALALFAAPVGRPAWPETRRFGAALPAVVLPDALRRFATADLAAVWRPADFFDPALVDVADLAALTTIAFLRAGNSAAPGFASLAVTEPVLALAMALSSRCFSVENSIHGSGSIFQVAVTKLIAEGLPATIRTAVAIKLPFRWSMSKTVISSLS